jgi:hypothetical protein
MDKRFKIWVTELDENGNEIGKFTDEKSYINFGNAIRRAGALYGDKTKYDYFICERDPWVEYHETFTCKVCELDFVAPVTPDYVPIAASIHMSKRSRIDATSIYRSTFRSKSMNFGYICPDCYEAIVDVIETLKKRPRRMVK